MDTEAFRRLHYAAAIACGLAAAIVVQIALTMIGVGPDTLLRDLATGNREPFYSALAWWAVAGAGFGCAWGAGAYLTVTARARQFISRWARRFLIVVAFAITTAGGIMANSDALGGATDVIAGLSSLMLGLICALCGARLAYLNARPE